MKKSPQKVSNNYQLKKFPPTAQRCVCQFPFRQITAIVVNPRVSQFWKIFEYQNSGSPTLKDPKTGFRFFLSQSTNIYWPF